MNILYVHNVGQVGGAERVTLDIITALRESEHSAFLGVPERGPLLDAASELGANAIVFRMFQPEMSRPLASLSNFFRWRVFLKDNSIDLIHTGDLFVTRSLASAANSLGLPVICHIHFPIEKPALRWIFKHPPRKLQFIYCCQDLRDRVEPVIRDVVANAAHLVVHNGVDTELYQQYQPKKGLLPVERFNIGIIANLQARKGHMDLIEAISLMEPLPQGLLVHIIGGDIFGEERESLLKARVEALGLNDYFVFHGQKSNVRNYLNELDLFVCASHEEAFPISILEAMAFALPIVSTDVNGIPEALKHQVNALLVKPGSIGDLKSAILLALEDKDLKERLQSRARCTVIRHFDLTVFSKKLMAIYSEL